MIGRRVGMAGVLVAVLATAGPAHAVQPGRNGLLATPFDDNEESPSSTGTPPSPVRHGYLGLPGGKPMVRPFAWCESTPPATAPCQKFGTVEFSPDGTQIADARPGFGLSIRRLDGTVVRQVTPIGVGAWSPTWAPDGSRLAFLDSGDVFTVRADGTGLRRITRTESGSAAGPASSVSWSSRGRLAVTFLQAERTTIATMAPAGGGARVMTRMRGRLSTLDWAPDGRRMLVSGDDRIALVDTRGRRRVRVLRRDGERARMSPDGTRIAFYPTHRPVDDNTVVVMRADGRGGRSVSLVDSETGYPDEGSFEYLRETGPLSWQPLP